jgi:DNA-binding beta-propeller fold protein YncE
LFAVGVVGVAAALLWALPAVAAERIYWDNYRQEPASIGFSALDGSGGGLLNTTGATIKDPEGMTYDSATGRIYVASSNSDEIIWVNVDGSGAGTLSAPGAPIEDPVGVAVDPATRTIYWVNGEGNGAAEGSIAWAKLDGSGGGMLNTSGASLSEPYRLAVDPSGGRVYWTNFGTTPQTISYANLDNSGGGGELDVSGASEPNDDGLAIDSAAGRIYWLNSSSISYASLSGGNGGDLAPAGATFDEPYGLALDPSSGVLYWANYGVEEGEPNGIGFESISGTGGGAITPTTLTDGPQDPVILKSPSGTGAPQVSGDSTPGSVLSCSQGSWAADYAGAFVYQAPQGYAYQWSRDGSPIAGANSNIVMASDSGDYSCTVTATNHEGSATQSSSAFRVAPAPQPVTPAPPKLTLKVLPHKGHAKAGKAATFKAIVRNVGGTPAQGARVCIQIPKKQRKALKAPKCRGLGAIAPGGKRVAKLRVHAKRWAHGAYKLAFRVRGAGGAGPVTRKLVVRGGHGKSHRHGKRAG